MASLHIAEFSALPKDAQGNLLPVADCSYLVTEQVVSFTTSTQSLAFNPRTTFVRLCADAKAYLAFGDDPTAGAGSMPLPADYPEFLAVRPGKKVAAYDGTS